MPTFGLIRPAFCSERHTVGIGGGVGVAYGVHDLPTPAFLVYALAAHAH